MAAGKIEEELSKATKIKRKPRETEQEFRTRLAQACDEIEDKVWAKLSSGAQSWVKAAMAILNENEENKTTEELPPIDAEDEKDSDKPARRGAAARSSKPAEKEKDSDKPVRRGAVARSSKANGSAASDADSESDRPRRNTPSKSSKDDDAKPAVRARQTNKDGTPLVVRVKQILLDDLNMPVGDLMKALEKEGYTPSLSSTTTIRSDFRHSIRVLKEQKANLRELTLS